MGKIINFVQARNNMYGKWYAQVSCNYNDPDRTQLLSHIQQEQQRFNLFCFQEKMKTSIIPLIKFNKVSNYPKY